MTQKTVLKKKFTWKHKKELEDTILKYNHTEKVYSTYPITESHIRSKHIVQENNFKKNIELP